jgi:hypothetical protein
MLATESDLDGEYYVAAVGILAQPKIIACGEIPSLHKKSTRKKGLKLWKYFL